MDEHFQFDREMFKDAVHYAVHYSCNHYGPDMLGNTKLHKILYFADMLHYVDTGQPLTGADYQRQRFGPTARHLSWSLKGLEAEGRVSVARINYFGYSKSEYHSLSEPPTSCLAPDQRGLIEHIVGFVCASTAVEISEFSHDDVWASVPMGARIPYYAAFAMFPAEITEDDIDDATAEAIRLAPVIAVAERDGSIF